MAVSRWNAEILRHIRPDVHYCPLGVDTKLFSPGPRDHRFGKGRFVVFSGGKAEYRKGQDLVLAAFKPFQQRHPDAVLVVAWHNLWPATAEGLAHSAYGTGGPPLRPDGTLGFAEWAARFGIPATNFVDLGQISNRETGALLRAAHVALFPNRAEGGTNMVAMECLAAGVPTILSNNSGHRDLIAEIPCFALDQQRPIGGTGLGGWAESSVDEIVATLEKCYESRDMARDTGRAAAKVMQQSWGWGTRMDAQIAAMGMS
jgi:glycosyltransferase involved in cell wall biosynthesis